MPAQKHCTSTVPHPSVRRPENLLFSSPGADAEPVIGDFGLALVAGLYDAHLAPQGVPIGSPAYSEHESVMGCKAGAAVTVLH